MSKPITREELTGAIRFANANSIKPRIDAVRAYLSSIHKESEVDRIVSDLDSYPDWVARKDLDA